MPDGLAPVRPGSALANLPNLITLARLCAVPLAIWLVLRHELMVAFGLFVLAGLSDAVDGWLARRLGPTALGAILDPVADKALLVGMYVTLAAVGVLPDWLAILVVFRDVVIIGGVLVLWQLGHRIAILPPFISKLNTAAQILLVAAALLWSGLGLEAPLPVTALTWLVAATTLASGATNVWIGAHAR